MLNKRMKVAVCVLCSVVAIAALLLPVVESTPTEAVEAFSPMDRELTVIIDPGHGGADGGAVSLTGVYESEINLSIAHKLEQVFAFMGIEPCLTRSTTDIDYPSDATTIRKKKVYDQNSRVQLVNSIQNGILISIHQNKYTSTSPSGAQVLYAANAGSNILADSIQISLTNAIGEERVRSMTQVSSDIYLMKNITCPAVLVECGFISNPSDEALLLTDKYQLKLACGIASGYTKAADELIRSYGGTNES